MFVVNAAALEGENYEEALDGFEKVVSLENNEKGEWCDLRLRFDAHHVQCPLQAPQSQTDGESNACAYAQGIQGVQADRQGAVSAGAHGRDAGRLQVSCALVCRLP